MENYTETFGPWQGSTFAGAVALVPASAASYRTTAVSFAGTTDAVNGLAQPQAMRIHKSITRPGSPPRGRLR